MGCNELRGKSWKQRSCEYRVTRSRNPHFWQSRPEVGHPANTWYRVLSESQNRRSLKAPPGPRLATQRGAALFLALLSSQRSFWLLGTWYSVPAPNTKPPS